MIAKICGITNSGDAKFALDAGADWIGLNLVAGPRKIDVPTAERILEQMQEPSRAVVLVQLVDGRLSGKVEGLLRPHGVKRIQMYGEVTPASVCELTSYGLECIWVQPVAADHALTDLDAAIRSCGDSPPQYVLLDSGRPQKPDHLGPTVNRSVSEPTNLAAEGASLGGTGRLVNWNAIARWKSAGRDAGWPPMILAGGLHAGNVGEAIAKLRPAGVDVSSGVESTFGRKDRRKLTEFLSAVRRARPVDPS